MITPGLIYVSLPLLLAATILSFALATIHPFAWMFVALAIGGFVAVVTPGPQPSLSKSARWNLLAIAACLGLLALLSSGTQGIGATLFGEPCRRGCGEYDWSDYRWLVFAPAIVHAPIALLAAVTAGRRVALALGVSVLFLAGQVGLLAALVLLFLASPL